LSEVSDLGSTSPIDSVFPWPIEGEGAVSGLMVLLVAMGNSTAEGAVVRRKGIALLSSYIFNTYFNNQKMIYIIVYLSINRRYR
jgi:hypothetical protein